MVTLSSMRIFVALAIVAVCFAACDSGDGSFQDVQAVVDALEDEGIECVDLETTDQFGSEADAGVTERGYCSIEEEQVAISLFEDAAGRREWVSAATITNAFVAADNWVVNTASEELLDDIADALDGSIVQPKDDEEDE